MKKPIKKIAALAAAMIMIFSAFSCSKKGESDESESSAAEVSAGEFVTNPDEPDLGSYTVSEKGTKLYYSPDEFSSGLITALEDYFLSFEHRSYDEYKALTYPYYLECMDKYLQENFGYNQQKSFELQCDNFRENAGGEFKITRLKVDTYPEGVTNDDGTAYDGVKSYLENIGEMIGDENFYSTVSANCDKLHHMVFYLMVMTEEEEFTLYSEYEIVVAEKDGKYYTFG